MNTIADCLRTGSARLLRLHGRHKPRGPRRFRPLLEDLECRVVPSGGGTGPGPIRALVSPNTPAASPLVVQALLPRVSVIAPDPSASEDPTGPANVPQTADTATFRIRRVQRDQTDEGALTVFFTLGGTAQNGVDYVFIPGSVTIPAGQNFVDLTVVPYPRAQDGPPVVTVTLTLLPGEDYNLSVAEVDQATASITQQQVVPPTPPPPPPVVVPPTPVPVVAQPPPPVTTPPVTVPPVVVAPVNQAALALALLNVPPTPSQSHFVAQYIPVLLTGLPLDPALRDMPGGLLPRQRLDGVAISGGTTAIGQISGKIFDDLNGTGAADAFKPGLPGVTVFLDLNNNGVLDPGEPQTTTNPNGEYAFTGLKPGAYVVRQGMPGNVVQTLPPNEAPYEVLLHRAADAAATNRNFGLQFISSRGSPVGTTPRRLAPAPVKPTPAPTTSTTPTPGGGGDGDGGPDEEPDSE